MSEVVEYQGERFAATVASIGERFQQLAESSGLEVPKPGMLCRPFLGYVSSSPFHGSNDLWEPSKNYTLYRNVDGRAQPTWKLTEIPRANSCDEQAEKITLIPHLGYISVIASLDAHTASSSPDSMIEVISRRINRLKNVSYRDLVDLQKQYLDHIKASYKSSPTTTSDDSVIVPLFSKSRISKH